MKPTDATNSTDADVDGLPEVDGEDVAELAPDIVEVGNGVVEAEPETALTLPPRAPSLAVEGPPAGGDTSNGLPSPAKLGDDAIHAPIGVDDDDGGEHTLERPAAGADQLQAIQTQLGANSDRADEGDVDQAPDVPPSDPPVVDVDAPASVGAIDDVEEPDFEEKTTEFTSAAVPGPISMGPRTPILDAPVSSGDAASAILARSPTPAPAPPPPTALYEDPSEGGPAVPPPVGPDPLDLAAIPPGGSARSAEGNPYLDEKTADFVLPRPPGTQGGDEESHLSTDEGATMEGAPLEEQRTDVGPLPPNGGETLTADDGTEVRLEESLGEQNGMVFFKARLSTDGVDAGQPFTAVWTPQAPAEPPWSHIPDGRVVRPRCRVTLDRAAVRVFERPKGNTVVDYLADDEKLLPAMATIELGLELAEILESLHGAGYCIYDLDPSQIVIEKGGRVRLYAVSGIYPQGTLPLGPLGVFCAPEVRRRMGYRVSAAADVFAVSLLLYALLAKRAPLDIQTDPALLVTPRVFRPECPLGVWPSLRPGLDPNPARRVGHARAFRHQLETARGRLIAETKATEDQVPIILEGWAEQHVGITKARRGSNQQDRALSVTDETGRTGLYVISDGVSRSKYGDGAFAAEQVEVASIQRWTGLEKAGPQALALDHPQRADILKQISRSAGKRIAAEINAHYTPIPNEPNQVMSATLVTAFVVKGEATIGNLGDSRAYLVRDGTIEQISIDHDRCTDALRLGLSFRESAHIQMGTALTRVVGRVIIDEDGSCRPDPFEPEIFRMRLLPGDRLVLCSDGVADFAAGAGAPPHDQDQKIMATVLEYEDPARAAFELVVLANRAGGYDNISCVVLAAHAG